jgi:Protein of unknown function (DUF2569)
VLFVVTRLWVAGYAGYWLWQSGVALGAISRGLMPYDSVMALTGQMVGFAFELGSTLFGLWLLAKLAPETPRYWVVILPMGIAAVFLVRLGGAYRFQLAHAAVAPRLLTEPVMQGLVGVVAQPLAWTAYWLRSARVRQTFCQPASNEALQLTEARTAPQLS